MLAVEIIHMMDIDGPLSAAPQTAGKRHVLPHQHVPVGPGKAPEHGQAFVPKRFCIQLVPNDAPGKAAALLLQKRPKHRVTAQVQVLKPKRVQIAVLPPVSVVKAPVAHDHIRPCLLRLFDQRAEPVRADIVVTVHESQIAPLRRVGTAESGLKQSPVRLVPDQTHPLILGKIALQ